MIVADMNQSLELTGNGDVLEPEPMKGGDLLGVGSGGNYAVAAARALIDRPDVEAEEIVRESMKIASDLCVFDENIKDGLMTLQRLLRLSPMHFTDDRYSDPVLLVDVYKVWETARSLKCIIKESTTALPVVQKNPQRPSCNTNKVDQKEVADSCFLLDETATMTEVDSHDVTPLSSTVSTSSLPAPAPVVVIDTTTMATPSVAAGPISKDDISAETTMLTAEVDYIILSDISEGQLENILVNLNLSKLIHPFRTNEVDGSLLIHAERYEDLTDIDTAIKPIFARTLLSHLAEWKNDGWRVPRKLLNAGAPHHNIPIATTTGKKRVTFSLEDDKYERRSKKRRTDAQLPGIR
eukprot:gene24451-32901_t